MAIDLPGNILRSKNLTIRGAGPGAWSVQELAAAMPGLLEALKDIPLQPVRVAKLADVEMEWKELEQGSRREGGRLVFVP